MGPPAPRGAPIPIYRDAAAIGAAGRREYHRVMGKIREGFALLKAAGRGMGEDMAGSMAAAVAYYTAFSIAPLLVITLGVAGLLLGEGAGAGLFDAVEGLVGAQGGGAVRSMVEAAADRPRAGALAAALGALTMLLGASGVFGQLQAALNLVWKVATKPSAGWGVVLRQRLLSFGMVAVVGFLLLVSLVASAALAAAGGWAQASLPGGRLLWSAVNGLFSFAVTAGLFAALFKLLPDVRLRWRDVALGGAVTAALFTLGKAAIGAYLGRSGVASAYGAAGAVVVLLLWVYYSAQILLFGAELTRAIVTRHGRSPAPKEGATLTLTPAQAAARAELETERAEDLRGLLARGGSSALYGAGAGLLAAVAVLLHRRPTPTRRLAAGAALGAGAGLVLIGAGARRAGREPGAKPSLASRALGAIPANVKLAAAGGALEGAVKEAARGLGETLSERPRRRHGRRR